MNGEFDNDIKILTLPNFSNKAYRVGTYLTTDDCSKVVKEILTEGVGKHAGVVIGCTITGAAIGGGIGTAVGCAGGPCVAICAGVGAGIGGTIGFAVGSYIVYTNLQDPIRKNYDAWRSKVTNDVCMIQLRKITIEHELLEPFRDEVTLELIQIPVMITVCGHTFDKSTIDDLIISNRLDCPKCRAKFNKNLVKPDVTFVSKMQKAYTSLAKEISESDEYLPEVSDAFRSLSKDLNDQLRHMYTCSLAELTSMYDKKEINLRAFTFKRKALDDDFLELLYENEDDDEDERGL